MREYVLTKSVSLNHGTEGSDNSRLRLAKVRGPRYAFSPFSLGILAELFFLLLFFEYRDDDKFETHVRSALIVVARLTRTRRWISLQRTGGSPTPRGLVRLILKDGKEIDAPLGTRTFVPNRIESRSTCWNAPRHASRFESIRSNNKEYKRVREIIRVVRWIGRVTPCRIVGCYASQKMMQREEDAVRSFDVNYR